MHDLNKIFLAVADALNVEATSIIEKDYYVVELLRLLQPLRFETHEFRPITSLVYDLTKIGKPIEAFPSVTITSTSVEKLIAILRRTAAVTQNAERTDDHLLIRHIYD
ncbi:hypothetical protein [Acinetobacter haemolyticus]|uniref:hypothetical protein n=1 Tax=Acinetobacter haemolyticus TaxID=29430 RepID=UPI00196A2240|nr:hypothetical protein [Acinetobacter haemolyticus]